MAITKILARKGRLDISINYILNGDKTEERVLTAHLSCDPGRECRQMLDTKRAVGKTDGVQYTISSSPSSRERSPRSWRWRSPRSSRRSIWRAMKP